MNLTDPVGTLSTFPNFVQMVWGRGGTRPYQVQAFQCANRSENYGELLIYENNHLLLSTCCPQCPGFGRLPDRRAGSVYFGLRPGGRHSGRAPNTERSITEQDLLALTDLNARNRNVESINGLEAARNLLFLDLESNLLSNVSLPGELTNLGVLDLSFNLLTNFSMPSGLTNLAKLEIAGNFLSNFTLPAGLTGLASLGLANNQITNFELPSDLVNLGNLDLSFNALTNFSLPSGQTNLFELSLSGNQITSLTLPPDVTQLTLLHLDGNPLTTLVLPEPLAATNLADTVTSLRSQGISVFTYPLEIQLISPRRNEAGAFEFTLIGPPGVYSVLGSTDLFAWNELGKATNQLGTVIFTDVEANLSPQKFYRMQAVR